MEFDATKDKVCLAIRHYLQQSTESTTISRNATVQMQDPKTNEMSQIPVGNMMYALRTRYRASNQTPSTIARVEALKDIPLVMKFLNMKIIPKQRTNTSSVQILQFFQKHLHEKECGILQLEYEIAKEMTTHANQEHQIYLLEEEKRQQQTNKRRSTKKPSPTSTLLRSKIRKATLAILQLEMDVANENTKMKSQECRIYQLAKRVKRL